MESDGRDTDTRLTSEEVADNVVRFPRDWFGPIEDLVPFGPRARGESAAGCDQATGESATVFELSSSTAEDSVSPASANDFWGEDSASVHQAVEPPTGPEAPPGPDFRGSVLPRLGLAGGMRPLQRLALEVRSGWRRFTRNAGLSAGRLAAAVAACLVVAVAAVGSLQGRPAQRALAEQGVGELGTAANPLLGASPFDSATANAGERAGHTGRARGTRQLHEATKPRDGARQSLRSGGGVGSSRGGSARTLAPSYAGSSGGKAGGSGGEASRSSAAAESGSGSSSVPVASPAAAGPVGPGAAFGPGHLG